MPTTIDGAMATAELVLDRLAHDRAVVVTNLVPPNVCMTVAAQRSSAAREDGCLALASFASHALLAHPLVVEVCDAVLGCQALRMPESELSDKRVVLGGSFTSQRPLRQLAWELDYARCDGNVHRASNPAPAVPSLLALEQQLTVVWQLSDKYRSGLAGALLSEDGSRVPVSLRGTGTALLILGRGSGRWQQNKQHQHLQAIGYQLGFLQPAQNHYLLAATEKSKDNACWHEAVQVLPVHIQRLLGFHMPGQVLNKVYAAPGPPDILSGLNALAGHPINWAHFAASDDQNMVAPVVADPDSQQYVFSGSVGKDEKLQLMRRAQEAADNVAATQGVPPASVTELVSREPDVS